MQLKILQLISIFKVVIKWLDMMKGCLLYTSKKELEQLLATSPLLEKHFKVLRTHVECLLTKSMYKPLNYSNNRMDGRLFAVIV